MRVGDLVKLDPAADWSVDHPHPHPQGLNALGLILQVFEPATTPFLFEVLWPNGHVQKLYGDELLLVRKPRKGKISGAASFKNNSNKKSAKARRKR